MLNQNKLKTIDRITKICQDENALIAIPNELSLSLWFDFGGEGDEEKIFKNEKSLFEHFKSFIDEIDQDKTWEDQESKKQFVDDGLTRIERELINYKIYYNVAIDYTRAQKAELSDFLLDVDASWEVYGAVICTSKESAFKTQRKIAKYDRYSDGSTDYYNIHEIGESQFIISGFSCDVLEKIVNNIDVFETDLMYLSDTEQLDDFFRFLVDIKYVDENDFIKIDDCLIQSNIEKPQKLHYFLDIINDLSIQELNESVNLETQNKLENCSVKGRIKLC